MGISEETLEKFGRYHNPSLARLLKFTGYAAVEEYAEGVRITDSEGRTFIDCGGGYGVFSLGHRHPRVVQAVKDQLDRMPMSSKVLINKQLADLAERLAQVTPGDLQYSFFCNSGTEAVEGALKLARLATGRTRIVAAENAFHGKTFGGMSASGRDIYKEPFQPLVPGFDHVPFGDTAAMAAAVNDDTAAVILEPVQGEGGVVVPPDDYLPAVRRICDEHGVLLILDEVQTGLGRTGRLFACEHWDVVPDIMTMAKALGGGVMPIGAFTASAAVWKCLSTRPLIHTSTFGGNQLACAAGIAAVDAIVEERLPERAAVLGERMMAGLEELRLRYPDIIKEVRGKGLLIGLELTDPGYGGYIIPEMVKGGVTAVYTLNNPGVIRFEPPLVITEEDIDTVLRVTGDAVARAAGAGVNM
ncbi:MAG: aspartate aminotransferase family protein [bacterium]|nr:aspartate aminotransferase family protein [bacterium]